MKIFKLDDEVLEDVDNVIEIKESNIEFKVFAQPILMQLYDLLYELLEITINGCHGF